MGHQTLEPDMAAQKRSSGKNYIDLVADEHERQSLEPSATSVRAIKDHLLGLIAALRSTRDSR